MKAILVSQYGGPEVMKFEDYPDPSPGPDEVLVRVAAVGVNPIDVKRRSGEAKAYSPITFPGILGVDVAGTVVSCGPKVTRFSVGDRVFGMADHTYAELCVVKAESLAKIPAGLGLIEAAALPLVTTTGYQLIANGARVRPRSVGARDRRSGQCRAHSGLYCEIPGRKGYCWSPEKST